MGLDDGRGEIAPIYTQAGERVAAKVFKDIAFPSGIVESHRAKRAALALDGALILRELVAEGILTIEVINDISAEEN